MIVWLEDQKIRHYKIEERQSLRNINDNNWDKTFQKVIHLFKLF
jgi:RLL motif-containing protein 1